MYEHIKIKLDELSRDILVIETENAQINKQVDKLKQENVTLFDHTNKSVEAVSFIETVAAQERTSIKSKIEKIITEALAAVYGDEYSIEFQYTLKRNRTSVDILLTKQTPLGQLQRDMDGYGGGVADTICLPLKLLVMVASQSCDKVLIADEPGKHLDVNRVEKFFEFLKELSDKLGVQLIVNSHHPCAVDYADVVQEISIDSNVSKVKRIK